MDQREALELARRYKQVIIKDFKDAKVYMYGSYSKGTAKEDSDIDVAVILPKIGDNWWTLSTKLWGMVDDVSFLIEPVLLSENDPSPLYADVMRTGIAVK